MNNEPQEIRKALLPELYAEIRWWRTIEQWSFNVIATVVVGALAWSAQNPGKIEPKSLILLTIALFILWAIFTCFLHGNLKRSMVARRMLHSIQIRAEVTEITEASERWSLQKSDAICEHEGTLHLWVAATILSVLLSIGIWIFNLPSKNPDGPFWMVVVILAAIVVWFFVIWVPPITRKSVFGTASRRDVLRQWLCSLFCMHEGG